MPTETEIKPDLTPRTITPPDVSKLPSLDYAAMMALQVTDAKTEATAVANVKAAKAYIENVNTLFEGPTAAANAVHKFLTGLRGQFTSKAAAVEEHSRKQIIAYQREEERKRQELERQLREKAEKEARERADAERQQQLAEARRLQAEAEAKRQQELDDLPPWEQDAPAVSAKVEEAKATVEELQSAPIPVYVPDIVVPRAAPTTEGLGSRNSPLKYRVNDINALIKAAATNPALAEYLTVNDPMIKAKLKTVGIKLSEFIPGVEAYRETGITIR